MIHRRSISVGDSIGKLITDGICVLRQRKNFVGKTVKSCSVCLVSAISVQFPQFGILFSAAFAFWFSVIVDYGY